ncbi:hypothetical protein A2U01_0112684, partial [Trifolium medium]|nr:hypothetical protein [Trifolium medium]
MDRKSLGNPVSGFDPRIKKLNSLLRAIHDDLRNA